MKNWGAGFMKKRAKREKKEPKELICRSQKVLLGFLLPHPILATCFFTKPYNAQTYYLANILLPKSCQNWQQHVEVAAVTEDLLFLPFSYFLFVTGITFPPKPGLTSLANSSNVKIGNLCFGLFWCWELVGWWRAEFAWSSLFTGHTNSGGAQGGWKSS